MSHRETIKKILARGGTRSSPGHIGILQGSNNGGPRVEPRCNFAKGAPVGAVVRKRPRLVILILPLSSGPSTFPFEITRRQWNEKVLQMVTIALELLIHSMLIFPLKFPSYMNTTVLHLPLKTRFYVVIGMVTRGYREDPRTLPVISKCKHRRLVVLNLNLLTWKMLMHVTLVRVRRSECWKNLVRIMYVFIARK